MRLFIGGMRGSQPSIGAVFKEFGGDTTCLLLVGSSGDRLVLDAGTGMHTVAKQLAQTGLGKVTVLFSHYHLDHMIGLTMNPLFYKPDWSFKFVGPTFNDGSVRDAVTLLLAPPYWPVPWDQMSARFEFTDFAMDEIHVGRLRVRKCQVPHPGGCLAYRIDESGCDSSLVFATDLEWRSRTDAHETAFMAMCREPKKPDALVIDAHFASADEDTFTGWGHSSWEDCLEIAESIGVEQVILGHHAPDADDKVLLARERQVKKRTANGVLARAGQWLTIGANEHKVQSC